MDETWEAWLENDERSYAHYVRDRFAEKIPNSNLFCDTIGDCALATCDNINPETSTMTPKIRQNTFYVFEQLTGLVYFYQSASDASARVGTYMYNRIEGRVAEYSNVKSVQRSMKIWAMRRKLILSIIQGIALIAAGGLGIGTAAAEHTAFSVGSAVYTLVLNSYIAIVGVYNTRKTDPEVIVKILWMGSRHHSTNTHTSGPTASTTTLGISCTDKCLPTAAISGT